MQKKILSAIFLALILVCGFWVVRILSTQIDSPESGPNNTSRSEAKETSLAPPIIAGYFAGTSNNHGAVLSWFLYLDSEKRVGEAYIPPGNTQIKEVLLKANGDLSFGLTDENGDAGRFEGRYDGKIEGAFIFEGDASMKVVLEAVPIESIEHKTPFSGLYSNVKYVKDAGDLVGTELFLFVHNDMLKGSITQYAGRVGPAHSLSNVELINNTIKFAVVTPEGHVKFSGEFSSSDEITLRRQEKTKSNEPLSNTGGLLRRKSTVAQMFKNAPPEK